MGSAGLSCALYQALAAASVRASIASEPDRSRDCIAAGLFGAVGPARATNLDDMPEANGNCQDR